MTDSVAGGPVRVLIVDDHEMFAESLARLLADESDIEVIGTAASGRHALEMAAEQLPDVVVLDYRLPDASGPEVARRLLDGHPGGQVVMLTGFGDEQMLIEAIDAGCAGFLTKDRAAAEVVDAVRAVAQGESRISPEMLGRLLPRLRREPQTQATDLTPREREVLELLAEGLSNRDIADRLFISVHTVRNHSQRILEKLESHSKLEAVSKAVRRGLISYPPPSAEL